MAVQWLRLCPSTAGGAGSNPGWETENAGHAGWPIFFFLIKKKNRNWNKNIEATECQTNFILMSQ